MHATTGRLSAHGIFIGLFLNPHLSARSTDTQIGPFHLSSTTREQRISKSQAPPLTNTQNTGDNATKHAQAEALLHFLLCVKHLQAAMDSVLSLLECHLS